MPEQNSDSTEAQPRDLVDKLRDLAVLRDQGVLNEAEFQQAKLRVLAEYQRSQGSGRDRA